MKNFKINKTLFFLVSLCRLGVFAQQKDTDLPKGNANFAAKKYVEAEADYRISHAKFPKNNAAPLNLGNTIYRQKQASEAKFAYATALKNNTSRMQKHRAFHNLGNVFMTEKNYSEAVEAYKNALRNDASDDETRYNYALAKKMLKENPPKNDKNKDKNKDKKDDKKQNENKDKKDDPNKDKDNKEGEKPKKEDGKNENKPGEPKEIPGGLSKDRLENLLNAVNNEEKKVQDKVNAQKVKAKPVKNQKDW